jgi:hypothetical protein
MDAPKQLQADRLLISIFFVLLAATLVVDLITYWPIFIAGR